MRDREKAAADSRRLRERKREHPEMYRCVCSRPGVVFKDNDVVCAFCHERELRREKQHADNRNL
jgi:hypothetical protein